MALTVNNYILLNFIKLIKRHLLSQILSHFLQKNQHLFHQLLILYLARLIKTIFIDIDYFIIWWVFNEHCSFVLHFIAYVLGG